MTDTKALLLDLLSRPSITPDDAGCMEAIAAVLSPHGIDCRRIDIETTANLYASHGSGSPHICFVGHTDVVPPGELSDWTSPPFTPTERGGKLYARGAADMKSGTAAMTAAFARLIAANPQHRGTLSLLLTSDEEGTADCGIQAVLPRLQAEGVHFDYAIVGEPTAAVRLGDTARCGRRGSLNLHLTIRGIQGHVAYPEQINNPIAALAQILADISAIAWDNGNAQFPPTSCQISNIQAGTGAENVVPERAFAMLNWRYNTEQTEAGIKAAVDAVIQRTIDKTGVQADCRWRLSGEPFATQNAILMNAVADASRRHTGISLTFNTAGGTSDARFMAKYGADTVEYGPCNASIHKIDEHVALDALEPLAAVYFDAVKHLWENHPET